MAAQSERRRWTAREVRQLIADAPLASPRYELVDGDLLVTPSPPFEHQRAVRGLLLALAPYCESQAIGEALDSPSDIELETESVRQPDVYVVSNEESRRLSREGFPGRELLLAVEVMSPSSAHFDRVRKRALYQRSVPEYWIVDIDARVVERWRQNAPAPEVLTESLTWQPPGAGEAMTLNLVEFFAKVLA